MTLKDKDKAGGLMLLTIKLQKSRQCGIGEKIEN